MRGASKLRIEIYLFLGRYFSSQYYLLHEVMHKANEPGCKAVFNAGYAGCFLWQIADLTEVVIWKVLPIKELFQPAPAFRWNASLI